MGKSILLPCFLAFTWVLSSVAGAAEQFDVHTVLEDAKLYVTAPVHWDQEDWLYFGGALVAIGASHAFDGKVSDHFATGSNAILNGKDPNSVRDAVPAALLVAGTFAYAMWTDDAAGHVETYVMLEAAGFSAVTSEALKFAAGRERPNETTSVNKWRAGGTSFPSLHATAAFAIGTVLAESGNDEYRWIRRILGYGVATGTAYLRLHDNVHWLSDTIAGAAIGMSTAHFTMNRRKQRDASDQESGTWSIAPIDHGGAMLSYTMPLH
ncbi:MAG: phosphatase PAP2 family protein [Acidobacteriota bacterium]|nr:phosphatase PAP2 family protein [Acidobacteriota bacterium]